MVKKLRAANVERQYIIQVSGHANKKSLNDYDEGSVREHRELHTLLKTGSLDNAIREFSLA